MTVLWINKVEISVRLKSHKGPVGFWKPDISKLDSLWNEGCQPGHHLHFKTVRARLPSKLVNVRANKPVQSSRGWSAEEYNRRCNCPLQDDICILWCHKSYNFYQGYRQTACWKREQFYFLDGGRDWTIIHHPSFFFIFSCFLPSAWSNADLIVIFGCCSSRCPSFLSSSETGMVEVETGMVEVESGTLIVWPRAGLTKMIAWNREN